MSVCEQRFGVGPVLLIVAHPDDEVLGAGSRLAHWNNLTLVHVTDGAPRNLEDARHHGFTSWQAYARTREQELERALLAGGVQNARRMRLGIPDQETIAQMASLARKLRQVLQDSQPQTVITHAYEGGHPDHDATAFSVHAACRLLSRHTTLFEFAGYHAAHGALTANEFVSPPNGDWCWDLSFEERTRKAAMLQEFHTQQETLQQFPPVRERFRLAPHYDFTQPPHEGLLYYERFGWNATGATFRQAAREAYAALGLQPTL